MELNVGDSELRFVVEGTVPGVGSIRTSQDYTDHPL